VPQEAQVPAGDAFSQRQRDDIVRAMRYAKAEADLEVSVYVGTLEGTPRPRAERLHAALDAPESSVLVAVDPAARSLEIVNGEGLRHRLDDRACGLAALAMTTAFAAGDLSGGIVNGVQSLAEHARAPRTLHLDTP
jgi:uncharacterized membrane protein YgcG